MQGTSSNREITWPVTWLQNEKPKDNMGKKEKK